MFTACTMSHCKMGPCHYCKKRHNITPTDTNPNTTINSTAFPVTNTVNSLVSFSKQNNNVHNATQVLLSTALIKVTNPITNKSLNVRALLDCGSQSSFISQSFSFIRQIVRAN